METPEERIRKALAELRELEEEYGVLIGVARAGRLAGVPKSKIMQLCNDEILVPLYVDGYLYVGAKALLAWVANPKLAKRVARGGRGFPA